MIPSILTTQASNIQQKDNIHIWNLVYYGYLRLCKIALFFRFGAICTIRMSWYEFPGECRSCGLG